MQQAEELGDFIYVPPKEDKEEEEEFTDAAQVSGGDVWGGGGGGGGLAACVGTYWFFHVSVGHIGGEKSRFPPQNGSPSMLQNLEEQSPVLLTC